MARRMRHFKPKAKKTMFSFKYKGFLVTIVNRCMWHPFNYEWEMVPLTAKARAFACGEKVLYDPTSWRAAKGKYSAMYWAKKTIDEFKLRHRYFLEAL